MYCSEALVGEVLETLLAQDCQDYAIVAIDDCSDDGTVEVASRYAARYSRLTVEANPKRLGMICTWNRVLERARELHPDFEFFAFASDNDPREPTWLSALIRELEQHPSAALAYSRFGVIRNGARIPFSNRWLFDSREIGDPVARMRAAEDMPIGASMYGLHRRSTLESAGDVPSVLFSDLLFLSHLALFGPFLQHPEVLWYRGERRTGGDRRRQRAALFGPRPPVRSFLPVSIQHVGWLARWMVLGSRRPAGIGRPQAAALTARYLARWITRFYLVPWRQKQRDWMQVQHKKIRTQQKELYRRRKRMRKSVRLQKRRVYAYARRGMTKSPAARRIYRAIRGRL
jgi:glycosyltransferase involved in cell wall biosynthesis